MRMGHVEELLKIATPVSSVPPSRGIGELAGGHGEDLFRLLSMSNGFYAFESALHLFPSGASELMTVELWNDPGLWRCDYGDLADGLVFFAEDIFGGQFVLAGGGVGVFDPETGDVEAIASDLDEWASKMLNEFDFLCGYPLAHAWQQRHGELPRGQRLAPKVPFVLGGAFEVDNLVAVDAAHGMRARGNLALQILELPDGATISYRIVE